LLLSALDATAISLVTAIAAGGLTDWLAPVAGLARLVLHYRTISGTWVEPVETTRAAVASGVTTSSPKGKHPSRSIIEGGGAERRGQSLPTLSLSKGPPGDDVRRFLLLLEGN
jgi:hypothetical protein